MKVIRDISHPAECFVSEGGTKPFQKRSLGTRPDPQREGITLYPLVLLRSDSLLVFYFSVHAYIYSQQTRKALGSQKNPPHMVCIKKHIDFPPKSPGEDSSFSPFVLFLSLPATVKTSLTLI